MIDANSVTAIVWDYDGTLVDTRAKNWAITRTLVQEFTGVDPQTIDALASLEGYTRALHRHHNWQQLYAHEFGMSAAMTREAGIRWTEYQLGDETVAPLYDGIEQVLHELAHLPHGIVSMNSRANIERALTARDLLRHFDIVIGYEEVAESRQKLAPDGLLKCLAAITDMAPGHVVYIGDHLMDIECARNAGAALADSGHEIQVFAVGAAYGIGAEFDAWPDDPDYSIAQPTDLLALVGAR